MKIYSNKSVLEEARNRIERIFEEFPVVVCGFSGGKDSTVVLNLALEIAEKLNRLPQKVFFLDQEAEWQGTIDYVKEIMYDKRIEPYWLQVPITMTNNASVTERYADSWAEGKEDEWLHEKDPISIKENVYGTNRFHELFEAFMKHHFPDQKACYLAGVRTEEAPKRAMVLTSSLTYKDITWGKKLNEKLGHYTFYPIYDWELKDVWKFIHDNGIPYNRIYDAMFRHGVSPRDMRISNLHHETAIQNLLLIQEIEPKTWNKISTRLTGSNAIKHLQTDAFKCPKKLPFMFKSWKEYAEYLIEKLVVQEKYKKGIRDKIKKCERFLITQEVHRDFYRVIVNTVLSSDYDHTKFWNFYTSQNFNTVKKFVNGKITPENFKINKQYNKYLKDLL